MKYVMQQRLLSWGNDYKIKNEDGADVYFVDGRAFSIGSKLSFQDMQGQELVFIKQVLLSFKTTYEIYRQEQLFAEVKKEFSFFKGKFTVDVPGPNDYAVEGDFSDYEYQFIRRGKVVAKVSKKFFSWSDTYGISIVDGEDDVTILATAVVIDQVCHSGDKE